MNLRVRIYFIDVQFHSPVFAGKNTKPNKLKKYVHRHIPAEGQIAGGQRAYLDIPEWFLYIKSVLIL